MKRGLSSAEPALHLATMIMMMMMNTGPALTRIIPNLSRQIAMQSQQLPPKRFQLLFNKTSQRQQGPVPRVPQHQLTLPSILRTLMPPRTSTGFNGMTCLVRAQHFGISLTRLLTKHSYRLFSKFDLGIRLDEGIAFTCDIKFLVIRVTRIVWKYNSNA